MESITIKVDKGMAKAIEQCMKPLYATKTEFIRAAIREQIQRVSYAQAAALVKAYKGKGASRTSDADLRRARESLE